MKVILAAVVLIIAVTVLVVRIKRLRRQISTGRELEYLLGQNLCEFTLIDIRTSGEYSSGHIPGALNVPVGECGDCLPSENMFQKIFVYGRSRRSAQKAAKILDENGYFNVTCYGAFRNWKGPVTTTEKS